MKPFDQLNEWRGEFGNAYVDRNVVDPRTRSAWLGRHIPADVTSVLEVGSNAGHNLVAIEMARPEMWTQGIEPNAHARRLAAAAGVYLHDQDIYRFEPTIQFDLVFTSGVLIHVPPPRLKAAMSNLYSASKKYLLAIEYRRSTDTMIEYRGRGDMLWAADYGFHYQRLFPDLEIVSQGALTAADGFKDSYFWLLRKPGGVDVC